MKASEALGAIIGIAGLCVSIYVFAHRETKATELQDKAIQYAVSIDAMKLSGLEDAELIPFRPTNHPETREQELANPKVKDVDDIVRLHIVNSGHLPVKDVVATIVTKSFQDDFPKYSVKMKPALDREVVIENQYLVIRLKSPLSPSTTVDMEIDFESVKNRREVVDGFAVEEANVVSEVGAATQMDFNEFWGYEIVR